MSRIPASFVKRVKSYAEYFSKTTSHARCLQKVQWSLDDDGRLSGSFKVEEEHLDMNAKLHPGFIFTFVDVVTGLGLPELGVSLSIKVIYSGTAKQGDHLEAKSFVASKVGNLAFLNVELLNRSTRDVVAIGKQTLFITENKKK